jgi:hypothetical protein
MLRQRRYLMSGTALSSRIAQWRQRGLIVSIQRGSISLNNLTSATATITAVNLANAILVFGGVQAAAGSGDQSVAACKIVLTNATTVTATVTTANANTRNVEYQVIEFVPGVIKSIQAGTITVSGAATSNTATVTAVDTAKSILLPLGMTTTYVGAMSDASINHRMSLTNATTVTMFNGTGSDDRIGSYMLVELF